jgi:hypothetical protein
MTASRPDPGDDLTRSTRLAANAGAVAVVAYAALIFVTTQVKIVRAASPFGDDPWDVVVSYGAIFVATVVGATGVRSLRHRASRLEPMIAARIRTGVAMTLVTIGVTLISDVSALLFASLPEPEAAADGRVALIVALIAVSGATAMVATALLIRARVFAAPSRAPLPAVVAFEPDVLDDLLGLARDGARLLPQVRSAIDRLISLVDRFLATSSASPRRHRLVFGVLGAAAAGIAFSAWHAIVEGPWSSWSVFGLFALLTAGGVFAVYIATLGPLRLIRPAG